MNRKQYNPIALQRFTECLNNYRKWTGINALNWSRYLDANINNQHLNIKFTRSELFSNLIRYKLNNKELSYAILSWGSMNRNHGIKLFKEIEWLNLVGEIRNKIICSREEAYNRFYLLRKEQKLPFMGPAYFTKLICFINPKLNGYIMDQWTAKSVNLICDEEIVRLTSAGFVDPINNDMNNYKLFCEIIDDLANYLNLGGIDVEESLFSNGGKYKGTWRQFVIDNY